MEKEASLSLWDSLESDTESLARERMYQLELQNRIHQANEMVNSNVEGDTGRQQGETDEEEEDDEDDSEEELGQESAHIYDSLDVAELRLGKRKPMPDDTEHQEIVQEEESKDLLRHAQVEDEYASLRYDPNWRNNLEGARLLGAGTTQLSLEEEGCCDSGEASGESAWKQVGRSGNGTRADVSAHGPVPAVSFAAGTADRCSTSKPPSTPYRPTPRPSPLGQTGSTAPSRPGPRQQLDWAEGPADVSGANQACVGHVENRVEEDSYEKMNERYAREYQLFYEQESARTNETVNSKQDSVYSKPKQSRRLSHARPTKPKEDIVERNKMTLGVRPKLGSYLQAFGQRGEKDHTNQESEAVDEISSVSSRGSQDDHLNPELRWQQKTRRLKVYKEKKTLRRERKHLNPIVKSPPSSRTADGDQTGPANPGVPQDRHRTRGRHLQLGHAEVLVIDDADSSSTAGTSRSSAMPAPQWRPDRSPYVTKTPTLNLNISLNAPADVTPFLSPDRQQTNVKLFAPQRRGLGAAPSVYDPTPLGYYYDHQVNPAQMSYYSPRQLPLAPMAAQAPPVLNPDAFPGHLNQRRSLLKQGHQDQQHGVPPLWDQENSSVHRMDYNQKWLSHATWQTGTEENLSQNPGDQHIVLQHQERQRLSHRCPSESSGSYKVLPPIGQTVASDTELSSQSPGQQMNTIQRSSSEGYLAQLHRQKQLKEKTAYKAYSLKDYKALRQDVKLGGLGPNYKVAEMTAEKMRRQKQYSNKVREQNKNLSRNPFLPAENLTGRDLGEDIVPRIKALEYARSIPKPKPPPQPKSREEAGKEDLHKAVQYLEDLDLSQLARLEMLQKRHEEEKQNSVN